MPEDQYLEVDAFAEEMKAQLRSHEEEKGGWKDCDPVDLSGEIDAQHEKLYVLLSPGDLTANAAKIRRRCAHIANFAMMIADLASRAR